MDMATDRRIQEDGTACAVGDSACSLDATGAQFSQSGVSVSASADMRSDSATAVGILPDRQSRERTTLPFHRIVMAAVLLVHVLAADVRGQRLLEIDGVELHGEAQLLQPGGGTCNVLESDTSYDRRKENDGAPMDIWRLDFTVRNRSGRWLDHLIARFQIASEWPECTNWDVPDSGELLVRYSTIIEWAGSIGFIQESGRNVVSPGQSLTDTTLLIVLRGDPEPRFSTWSVDFNFAINPPPAGTAASNPDRPPGWRLPVAATADREIRLDGPDCRKQPAGAQCWTELANQPSCYVWNEHRQPPETATWTGECSAGLAEGQGRLTWEWPPDNRQQHDGTMRQGRKNGHWVQRFEDGDIGAGPYLNGERNGHWIWRYPDGGSAEGPNVNGERNGHWVQRFADGSTAEGPYMNGKRNGHWVQRFADGDIGAGPYMNGKRNGYWVWRFPSGQVEEGPYVADEQHGEWVVRPPNGDTFTLVFVRGVRQEP